MIQTVVNSSSNSIKGYLVDDIFIKSCNLKYFTKEIPLGSKNIVGKIKGNTLDSNGVAYKEILSIISYSNYKYILNKLRSNNIILNHIVFIKCSSYDLDIENLSSFWEIIDTLQVKTVKYYICVDTIKDIEVAYIMTRDNLFRSSDIHISLIESLYKRKGYGKYVINELKELNKCISGISAVNAKEFWKSVGAIFMTNSSFVIY
jgi:hypothetical protein